MRNFKCRAVQRFAWFAGSRRMSACVPPLQSAPPVWRLTRRPAVFIYLLFALSHQQFMLNSNPRIGTSSSRAANDCRAPRGVCRLFATAGPHEQRADKCPKIAPPPLGIYKRARTAKDAAHHEPRSLRASPDQSGADPILSGPAATASSTAAAVPPWRTREPPPQLPPAPCMPACRCLLSM